MNKAQHKKLIKTSTSLAQSNTCNGVILKATKFIVLSAVMPILSFSAHANFFWQNPDLTPQYEVSISPVFNSNVNPTTSENYHGLGLYLQGKVDHITVSGSHAWQFKYLGEANKLEGDETVTTAGHSATLGSAMFLNDKNTVMLSVTGKQEEQAFGTGLSRLRKGLTEQDALDELSTSVSWLYGAETDQRYALISAESRIRRYKDRNNYAQAFDSNWSQMSAEMGFKVSSATHVLTQITYSQDNFVSPFKADSDLSNVLIGVNWLPTGKLAVRALAGKYTRETENQAKSKGTSWLASVDWEPVDYFSVRLHSEKTSTISELDQVTESELTRYRLTSQYKMTEDWLLGLHVEHKKEDLGTVNSIEQQIKSFDLSRSIHKKSNVSINFADINNQDRLGVFNYSQNKVKLAYNLSF